MAGIAAQDKKFQAESDMRTLVEAAVIKTDKPRHAAAMKLVREQRKALASLDKNPTQETA